MKRPTPPPSPPATTYTLVLYQRGDEDDVGSDINRHVLSTIQRSLDDAIDTPRAATEIEVWLDSPGGDAHAAYKLVLDLRSRARSLSVVVADYAKSAATLITLGMDTIFMSAAAELGPLDVQIEHPDREGVIVSALDVVGALDFLGRAATTLTLTGGASAIRSTQLSRSEILRDMLSFSAELVRPVVAKLDPHLLHRASRELGVAKKYAVDLIGRVHPSRRKDVDVPDLVRRLVEDYKAHGFAISRDEIRRLGFLVEAAEKHPHWPTIRTLQRHAADIGENMIFVATEPELQEMASKMQEGDEDEDAPAPKVDPDSASDGGSVPGDGGVPVRKPSTGGTAQA